MRSSGRIALAFAMALCERAYGQTAMTAEEARQQMLIHAGPIKPREIVVPAVVPPSPILLDPARLQYDFEEGRRLRNSGIGWTVVGIAFETGAMFFVWAGVGAGIGGSIGAAFCESFHSDGSGSCPTAWQAAEPYFRTALILALIGAGPLGGGLAKWHEGSQRMRKARGYSISLAPTAGRGFAGLGATLEF